MSAARTEALFVACLVAGSDKIDWTERREVMALGRLLIERDDVSIGRLAPLYELANELGLVA